MRRLVVLSTVFIALASGAGVALAATPVKGSWSGKSANFDVNAAGTRITGFRAGGCAAGPLPFGTIKVAADGKFSLKTKANKGYGGRSYTVKITGSFTSPTAASGSVRAGSCRVKFKAKALNPPAAVQPVVPDPSVPDPSGGY